MKTDIITYLTLLLKQYKIKKSIKKSDYTKCYQLFNEVIITLYSKGKYISIKDFFIKWEKYFYNKHQFKQNINEVVVLNIIKHFIITDTEFAVRLTELTELSDEEKIALIKNYQETDLNLYLNLTSKLKLFKNAFIVFFKKNDLKRLLKYIDENRLYKEKSICEIISVLKTIEEQNNIDIHNILEICLELEKEIEKSEINNPDFIKFYEELLEKIYYNLIFNSCEKNKNYEKLFEYIKNNYLTNKKKIKEFVKIKNTFIKVLGGNNVDKSIIFNSFILYLIKVFELNVEKAEGDINHIVAQILKCTKFIKYFYTHDISIIEDNISNFFKLIINFIITQSLFKGKEISAFLKIYEHFNFRRTIFNIEGELFDKFVENQEFETALCFYVILKNFNKNLSHIIRTKLISEANKYYLSEQNKTSSEEKIKELIDKRFDLALKTEMFFEAANIAENEIKDISLAIDLYEKANYYNKAIELTTSIESDEQNKVQLKLAELHKNGGNLNKAATIYETIGHFREAYLIFNDLKNYEKAIDCYLKIPEKEQNIDIIIELFRLVDNQKELIKALIKKNTYASLTEALLIAKKNNDSQLIVDINEKLKDYEISGELLKKLYDEALKVIKDTYSDIAGIDFGTSTSVCSLFNIKEQKVEIVTNIYGEVFEKSIFAIDEKGRFCFGEKAEKIGEILPDNMVANIKRHLGTNNKFYLNKTRYTPEEIAAHIIINLKNNINRYIEKKITEDIYNKLNKKYEGLRTIEESKIVEFVDAQKYSFIKEVVLTVPAYYLDAQKKATLNSVEISGLKIRRMIAEPTAAALAYSFNTNFSGHIIVFDLGGGTFDISILETGDGIYEVKRIGGNSKLGGKDIDENLVSYFVQTIKEENGIDLNQISYKLDYQRLCNACKILKEKLSFESEAIIHLNNFLNRKNYTLKLESKKLEELCSKFLNDLERTVREALEKFEHVDSIKHYILVGNATRMPAVQNKIWQLINAKQLRNLDPGTVVANGAAIQGAVMSGGAKNVLVLDIVPFSLGIEVCKPVTHIKHHSILIKRNTPIPARKNETYSTYEDNQKNVHIKVYQGESDNPNQNYLLGNFVLDGIKPAPKGVPKIEVTFEIDANCILKVTAIDKDTRATQSIIINDAAGLTFAEVEALKKSFELRKDIPEYEEKIKKIIDSIEKIKEEYVKKKDDFEKKKEKLDNLFNKRILDKENNSKYIIKDDEHKVIQNIFLIKEQTYGEIVIHNDFLGNKFKEYEEIKGERINYKSENINEEFLKYIKKIEDVEKELNWQFEKFIEEYYKRINFWLFTLENIEINLSKLTILERANYLIEKNKVEEAFNLLENKFENNNKNSSYLKILLDCCKKLGNENKYKTLVKNHGSLLDIVVPDLNSINNYVNNISLFIYIIQVTNDKGNTSSGTGFLVGNNTIITNIHVLINDFDLNDAETSSPDRELTPNDISQYISNITKDFELKNVKITSQNAILTPEKIYFHNTCDIAIIRTKENLKSGFSMGTRIFTNPGDRAITLGFPELGNEKISFNDLYVSVGHINSIRKGIKIFSTGTIICFSNEIGRGMSGGPLINELGEVIGIVTCSYLDFEKFNVIFSQPMALPIDLVKEMIIKEKI